MVILSEGATLSLEDLPEKISRRQEEGGEFSTLIPDEGFSLSNAINEYERQLIISALQCKVTGLSLVELTAKEI